LDILPQEMWHNVLMSSSAATSTAPVVQSFAYDWKAVERGIPLSALEKFSVYSGITMKELLEVVIPLRTLKHRRERKEPLNIDESDRLVRVARIYELAVKVYGDHDDGRKWLTGPKKRFDGRTALAMLRSESGERVVEELLYQIDEGVFA
jgi:putative toxin-antitoxin system antitoxin component (TIGR02293 family)